MSLHVNENTSSVITVGISDAKLSAGTGATLITYALGSCLGVTVYDPVKKIGGLLHCLLPLSNTAPDKAAANPFMFVDTGVTNFLNMFFSAGGSKDSMIVKIAGCGNMQDQNNHFNIGQRNHTVLRKILWKNNILIAAEMIGGTDAKTMSLSLSDGKCLIKTSKGITEL